MSQKVVFFGSGHYTIPIVKVLIGQNLSLVVTTEKKGRLVDYLKKENIPFIISDLKSKGDIERIKGLNSPLGILASFGVIVPKSVIQLFQHGILNIHPSLLPKYKGPSPIQYAIKNGDSVTGVTIIKLDNEIDHGPIVTQKEFGLNGDETLENLTEDLFKLGSEMIISIVQKLDKSLQIKAIAQDHSKEVFTEKITKKDGEVDLLSVPTSSVKIENWKLEIARKIRAYHPWPGVWFEAEINGGKIIKLLPNQKIKVEGKNTMSHKDFINGYGKEGEKILEKVFFTKETNI